jgi:S-adenosylmethionine synthetase
MREDMPDKDDPASVADFHNQPISVSSDNVGNDAYLIEDRLCRVACETLCKGKHVVLAGEITSLKPAMSPMNYTLCAVVLSTQELQRIEHTISLLDGYRSNGAEGGVEPS